MPVSFLLNTYFNQLDSVVSVFMIFFDSSNRREGISLSGDAQRKLGAFNGAVVGLVIGFGVGFAVAIDAMSSDPEDSFAACELSDPLISRPHELTHPSQNQSTEFPSFTP